MSDGGVGPWRTEFNVQPFVFNKRKLTPGDIRPAGGRDQAIRLGERLAASHPGVLVYSRRVAPDLGEYEDATVLATHGLLPPEVAEHLTQ